jgi:2-iminobutanoate/2-iminopropanoate deaminase
MKIIKLKKEERDTVLYSDGVLSGNLIFTGGKVGIDPVTGLIGRNIKEQTKLALENIKEVLEAEGASIENIIKVTLFITDMSEYEMMNEVYKEFFKGIPPARLCVGIKELAIPELKIEIDAIAEKK